MCRRDVSETDVGRGGAVSVCPAVQDGFFEMVSAACSYECKSVQGSVTRRLGGVDTQQTCKKEVDEL